MPEEQKTGSGIQMAGVYEPKRVESKWYAYWEENGFFRQEADKSRRPFSIVMPPPNVTGSLHMGHALNDTVQDVLTRFKRMQGYNTLWLPGTDHAGIATQAKVEEQLAKEGTSREELGRERFLERVWDWKRQYGGRITRQLRRLGASCDWSRERFTLDQGCSEAVREVFVDLYHKGLIYRGNYIVNWCPHCHTTISDIEVEHVDHAGHLYYLRYPLKGTDEFLTVATTRPETMLGDTAVAVHPEDERYRHVIGRTVVLPLVGREIPVIADDYVEREFGTGAVKITPAHDPNDFEMGLRHNLPAVAVLDREARMNENAGKYRGMDRYEARRAIAADLEAAGVLVRTEDHAHAVGECYRCATVIEPLVSRQWFVKMEPLAKPAMEAVRGGRLEFVPARFTKIYLGWLENIRDWCISRQLWWGHQIPVWYCEECGAEICAKEDPALCPSCGSRNLRQDPDVLDTWFSSGLWPFSTLGWPRMTPELEQFYPTSVLVTARDIIFFWVARMIFMALQSRGEVPFRRVMIHGLVLDAQGRKMSKSLGNGIDPIEVIDRYGADTLRFMLITGNTAGNDLRFHPERLEATRNFANKVWNASRFVLMNVGDFEEGPRGDLTQADRWILSRYSATVAGVTEALEQFDLGEAGRTLYEFIWNEFCDWYIELSKPRLYRREGTAAPAGGRAQAGEALEGMPAAAGDSLARHTAQAVLIEVLDGTLRLLHPFMPFLTEEIWQNLKRHLPGSAKSLMLAAWPAGTACRDERGEEEMRLVMNCTKAIRNIRAEMNISPAKKAEAIIVVPDEESRRMLEAGREDLRQLAGVAKLDLVPELAGKVSQAAGAVLEGIQIYVPLRGLLDIDKEIARIEKEIAQTVQEEARLEKKLNNPGFVAKAPPEVVMKEREKLAAAGGRRQALEERLKGLSD
ncbi:Valine-tRNA ligase [Acididesulfobacillus acetoxydans]|uniref:Valine--tRNA ligase n=1 Tax=Acididesulfobacillus acetoxydans TaxID=1561005 RepID=A0A8S0XA20_9FIRM|nr:valine--tRNA ligase [Acididesulfobacillus acetoxydans]CAA7599446.1 Valine-tRNA ligase [Acididesulfobacillus acetoxydans]CEJ06749.1 Valine--tRNA ligase [Acididesulfobacillus acetoxydans]